MVLKHSECARIPLRVILAAFTHEDRHIPFFAKIQILLNALRIGIIPVLMELRSNYRQTCRQKYSSPLTNGRLPK